jgi:hypothetical protein
MVDEVVAGAEEAAATMAATATGRVRAQASLARLPATADELTVQAPAMAAELLGRVVELFEPGPQRDVVAADWAVSLELSGRLQEAETLCRELLSRTLWSPGVAPRRTCSAEARSNPRPTLTHSTELWCACVKLTR